ncbi:hypothetical protein DMC30DRAFT_399480 [Rhodotorula diobovata]|uniref:Uncharacterized protein n=1 Tax=Rhodotorula diobovata TaxID=5288 RepID=A0A5C5FSB6_9BASI|nr:hypothetical protein DMC30DRAFT_399480 [Rhodotorula diobovata]
MSDAKPGHEAELRARLRRSSDGDTPRARCNRDPDLTGAASLLLGPHNHSDVDPGGLARDRERALFVVLDLGASLSFDLDPHAVGIHAPVVRNLEGLARLVGRSEDAAILARVGVEARQGGRVRERLCLERDGGFCGASGRAHERSVAVFPENVACPTGAERRLGRDHGDHWHRDRPVQGDFDDVRHSEVLAFGPAQRHDQCQRRLVK